MAPLTAASQVQNWALTRTRKSKKRNLERREKSLKPGKSREGKVMAVRGVGRCAGSNLCLKPTPELSLLLSSQEKNALLHNFNELKGSEKSGDAAQQSLLWGRIKQALLWLGAQRISISHSIQCFSVRVAVISAGTTNPTKLISLLALV